MPLVSRLGPPSAIDAAVDTHSAPLIIVSEPSGVLVGAAWLIWASWMTVSALRLAIAVVALGHAKRSAAPFPAARLAGLSTWAKVSSQGRQATLAVSDRVTTAAVLGLGRPVIAVSQAALDRLTDDELENVLLHEYAHVQRFDDLGMLAQRAVSAVFGLHPAVWWLGRALTLEREVACDDLVLAQARTTPRRYARSLVKLVEQARSHDQLRLAPGVIFSRPQLTRRIVRLLDLGRNATARPSRPTSGFAAAAIGFAVMGVLSVELVAIAAPTLTSRGVVSGWVQPFALVATSASGSTVVERSIARKADASETTTRQTGHSRPWPGDVQPVALPPASGTLDPSGDGALTPSTSGSLSAETIDVAVVVPRTSDSAARLTPDGATGGEATPPRAHAPPQAPTPWGLAADAASAIGRGSRTGAVKTAGLFTRIGKSMAGAF